MQMPEKPKDRKIIKPGEHFEVHHRDSDGWITLARKDNKWRQYHYKPHEITEEVLSQWSGDDFYFSQNTFYKPKRDIYNVRQLKALYVDVDCYLLNFDPGWVAGRIENILVADGEIPAPNLLIFSGRGVIAVWLLEPVPYQALPLWQTAQEYFLDKLKDVGGDPKATDAARVLRVAGSTNSSNGETVTVHHCHDYRYRLKEDIRDVYLPDLKQPKKKKGRPPKIVTLHNIRNLHYSRALDLLKLVELRDYDVVGYREFMCFLYRYWKCCFLADTEKALEDTLDFNQSFRNPLHEREVIKATRSAEKAWEARSSKEANEIARKRGYPGAGYNYSNKRLIEDLDITPEEQKYMRTIIGKEEKYYRNNKRRRKSRRKDGKTKRERQKGKTLDKLKKAIEKNPVASQKELAEVVGVSQQHISRLLKRINNNN